MFFTFIVSASHTGGDLSGFWTASEWQLWRIFLINSINLSEEPIPRHFSLIHLSGRRLGGQGLEIVLLSEMTAKMDMAKQTTLCWERMGGGGQACILSAVFNKQGRRKRSRFHYTITLLELLHWTSEDVQRCSRFLVLHWFIEFLD